MANRHRGSLFAVVTVALVAMALPRQAQAQDAAGPVWSQLEAVYDWAAGEGYSTRNYLIDKLDEDEVIKSALPGEMYRVFTHYKRDEWERFMATVTEWDVETYLDCLP